MITTSQMYWLTRLSNFHAAGGLFVLASILILVAVAVFSFAKDHSSEEISTQFRKWGFRIALPLFLVGFLIEILVPTTKEMAAIIIVPRIANNEKVQDVGNKIYDLAVQWMEAISPRNENDAD